MSVTPMAKYQRGKPIMQRYTPTAQVNAGDVVVIGNRPFVAHAADPLTTQQGTTVVTYQVDSLSVSGGIYQMQADAAYPCGTYVYFNPTSQQVTASGTAGGNCVPFGWIVGGPGDDLGDGGPTGAASVCFVHHDPTDDTGEVMALAATAADVVTAVAAATAFATTCTIPSGTLVAGDVLHIKAEVFVTQQNGNDTNLLVLQWANNGVNTTLVNTGAVNAHNNAVAIFDVDLVFNSVGNAGAFSFFGDSAFGANATRATLGGTNTLCNTNVNSVISVIDTQGSNSASNKVQLFNLLVEKRRR